MKQPVIAMRLHTGHVKINTYPVPIEGKIGLPDGCIGVLFAFESKKAARAYWGNDTKLSRFEITDPSGKIVAGGA